MIGEIRDRETMQQAISYAETGHLCLSTLHANNANQTIDRILNFFPDTARPQVLIDLSLNLKAVVSQRLLTGCIAKVRRVPAVEILLSSPYVSDLIFKGDIAGITRRPGGGCPPQGDVQQNGQGSDCAADSHHQPDVAAENRGDVRQIQGALAGMPPHPAVPDPDGCPHQPGCQGGAPLQRPAADQRGPVTGRSCADASRSGTHRRARDRCRPRLRPSGQGPWRCRATRARR